MAGSGIIKIKDILLFPGVRGGLAMELVENAAVLIKDGRFLFAGPEEKSPNLDPEVVTSGKGMLLMPSLVNAHAHSAMTLLRGVGTDLPLKEWLYGVIFPMEGRLTAEAAKAGVELAMLEYLRCGVTCFNDMYMFPEVTALAAGGAGMRSLITDACVEFSPGQGREQLDRAIAFRREYHRSFEGRVRASVSVHAEYTSTPDLVRNLVRSCDGMDNIVHVHLSETEREVMECKQRHGVSPVRYFHDLGLFRMPAVAAHCVWVEPEDMELLAGDGVTVAHNPVSNLKLGSGIAPVSEMLSRGIRLAIGTDGAASNDHLDLFEEIKLTGILDKGVRRDPALMSPARVIEAATVNAAAAMGYDRLGIIQEGWQADCILLDLDMPNLLPFISIPSALVYAARGDNVKMTMAQGRVLYLNGEYLTLDEESIRASVREAAKRLRQGGSA